MLKEFLLPSLGSGLKEATLQRWAVQPGDRVVMGQPVCEVETEKSVIELPAPFSGAVERLHVAPGESVKVDHPLLSIEVEGAAAAPSTEAAPAQRAPVAEDTRDASEVQGLEVHAATTRARAMPKVRKLARERGIDLGSVRGTGPEGRILPPDLESRAGARRVALSGLRRSIAEHMSRSWREIPHVFTRMDFDAGPILEWRRALSRNLGSPFPIEALLAHCALPALRAHPEFNARFVDEAIEFHSAFNIGIATDLPEGLTLTVIADADRMSLAELGSEIVKLTSQARSQALKSSEVRSPTFTVNNVGARGLLTGTSIIPYGTSAILSLGRAVQRPVVRDGAIAAGMIAELSLSFDHRIIDGGLAQQFMREVGERLAAGP